MVIDLRFNTKKTALPLKCGTVFSGSALPVTLIGVPESRGGLRVCGVRVRVTNAAGMPVTAECFIQRGLWRCRFSAANFAVYGFISQGMSVELVLDDGEIETVGVGDFEVVAANASAVKGEIDGVFMTKGADVYHKSEVVDGVQHYLKQKMVHDPDIGWGATWIGDYVLTAEGNFVEVAR
jgi:hypothetical protein